MDATDAEPQRPRVLVVDDDPLLGRVVEACLGHEGAEVQVAHTLAEARGRLAVDLAHVVLDRRLPDGDGLDLLEDLGRICPEVPVVVLSAYDDPGVPAHVSFVPKSDIAALVDVIGLKRPRPDRGPLGRRLLRKPRVTIDPV